jgi:site-specific DNA-methyltransferase (adenine-specific)
MSILSVVVWDKEWPSVGSMRGLRQNYELIVLFAKPDYAILDRTLGDIWKCKWGSSKPTGHPQEKPVALGRRIIEVSQLGRGALIVDPFCGSGSFGVAAFEAGCRFVGIDLEGAHIKLTERRLRETPRSLFMEASL